MVCFFLSLLKRKLPQRCPKRGGGGKATFGQCPKGSSFFFVITSLSYPGDSEANDWDAWRSLHCTTVLQGTVHRIARECIALQCTVIFKFSHQSIVWMSMAAVVTVVRNLVTPPLPFQTAHCTSLKLHQCRQGKGSNT